MNKLPSLPALCPPVIVAVAPLLVQLPIQMLVQMMLVQMMLVQMQVVHKKSQ